MQYVPRGFAALAGLAAALLLVPTLILAGEPGAPSDDLGLGRDYGVAIRGNPTAQNLQIVREVFDRFGADKISNVREVQFAPRDGRSIQGMFTQAGNRGAIQFNTGVGGGDIDPRTAAFLTAHAWMANDPRQLGEIVDRLPTVAAERYPSAFARTSKRNLAADTVSASMYGARNESWDPGYDAASYLDGQVDISKELRDQYDLRPPVSGPMGGGFDPLEQPLPEFEVPEQPDFDPEFLPVTDGSGPAS